MAGTSGEYSQRLDQLKAIATEKKLRDIRVASWKAKALTLLIRLQQDTDFFLSETDLTDLLEMLFTKEEFPEALEVEGLYETKKYIPNTATFFCRLEVGRGGWSVSVWSLNNKLYIFAELLA